LEAIPIPINPIIFEELSAREWKPSAVTLALFVIFPSIIFEIATARFAKSIVHKTFLYY
jgi:hypothetical protein